MQVCVCSETWRYELEKKKLALYFVSLCDTCVEVRGQLLEPALSFYHVDPAQVIRLGGGAFTC